MGLDMYLRGEKFYWTDWENKEKNLQQDGFKIATLRLELGYWRKHPNLHGYIVNTFADGKDECQEIELSDEDVQNIIDAVKAKSLPPTSGFFFGVSDESRDEETLRILEAALAWSKGKEENVSRSIIYQASW